MEEIEKSEVEKQLIIEEYISLRHEIRDRLSRVAKLQEWLLLGTLSYTTSFILPKISSPVSVFFFSFLIILPIAAFVVELLCTSEQDAVFRAGIYIRDNVERVHRKSIYHGWEDWLGRLDRVQRRRTSDNLLKKARRMVIIPLYCLASSVIGVGGLLKNITALEISIISLCVLISFFVYIGCFSIIIMRLKVNQSEEFSSPTYNVIVVDVDGCLYNNNREISNLNKEAVSKLKGKFIKIILASGRISSSINDICKNDLKIGGYHITSHGACVYDAVNNEETQIFPLKMDDIPDIIKTIEKFEFTWIAFGKNRFYCKEIDRDSVINNLSLRKDLPNSEFNRVFPIESLNMFSWSENIGKILCYVNSKNNSGVDALIKEFERDGNFKAFLSTNETLEIINAKASKAAAVKNIIDKYDISDVRSLVIGDYDNDLEILEWGRLAVAPSNASEKVKKIPGINYLHNISNDDDLLWKIVQMHFK